MLENVSVDVVEGARVKGVLGCPSVPGRREGVLNQVCKDLSASTSSSSSDSSTGSALVALAPAREANGLQAGCGASLAQRLCLSPSCCVPVDLRLLGAVLKNASGDAMLWREAGGRSG